MKKSFVSLLGVIIVVVIASLLYAFSNGKPESVQRVITFKANSDKTIYTSGEKVRIGITLTNEGKEPVCISEGALGNIRIMSISRDGEDVESRQTESDFIASFSEMIKTRLRSVPAGDTVVFDLASEFDPGLDAEALSETVPDDMTGVLTFYNITKPGTYELSLAYEYIAGTSDICKDVFEGKTNSDIVRFTVE